MSEIELVKRLRERAETEAKTSCLLANAKTERNRAAGDSYANYRGLSVDETLPWQAADAIEALTAALEWAIKDIDRNTCQHDDTHRAGVIWTICDSCGAKWADDEGGFQPYREKPELTAVRAALRKVRP